MPLALALAKLAHGGKALSQRTQLSQRQITARRESFFISLQRRGQLRSTKPGSRLRLQQTHPQLFGPRVAHIKILRHPAKTGRRPQPRPVGRLKGCPEKVGQPRSFPTPPRDARAGPANPPRVGPDKASGSECPNWDTVCGRPESQNGCSAPENASGGGVGPQTSPATHPEAPGARPPRSTPARPPIYLDN